MAANPRMLTRYSLLASCVLAPVFLHCTPIVDRDLAEEGEGASAGSEASAGSGASSPSGGTKPMGTGGQVGGSSTAGGQAGAGEGGTSSSDILGHPGAGPYPEYPGFTLTLVEEFDEPLDLVYDPIWTYGDGGLGEGQVRYTRDAISFGTDGALKVMKITTSVSNVQASMSLAENQTIPLRPLKSGELRTKFNNWRYGRYEARFKVPHPTGTPGGNGNLIQSFLVMRTPRTEDWREIDFEVTGDSPQSLTTNILFGNNKTMWEAGIQEAFEPPPPNGYDSRAAFHTYAIEWTPTGIKWSIDDLQVREKKASAGGLMIPEKSVKIIMNLWVFANTYEYGGPMGANNDYPLVAEYDWLRFYRWDTETTYPCSPTPGCLPAVDTNLSGNNAEEPDVPH